MNAFRSRSNFIFVQKGESIIYINFRAKNHITRFLDLANPKLESSQQSPRQGKLKTILALSIYPTVCFDINFIH